MGNWFDDAIAKGKDWAAKALDDVEGFLADSKTAASDSIKAIAANAKIGSLLNFKVGDTLIDSTLAKLTKLWNSNVAHGNDETIKGMVDVLVSGRLIPKSVGDNLYATLKGRPVLGPILGFVFMILTPLLTVIATIGTSVNLAQQDAAANIRPNLPDPSSILQAVFMDNGTMKRVKEILVRAGLQDQDIALLFKAQYATINEGTIRDLFFRGVYTEADVYKRLRENHYTDTRIKEIMQTWTLIPPVQDLITMAVREVFSPQQREQLGLDQSFPQSFKEWAEKQGLKSPWPENYWAAHWRLPSAEMGFEMYQRGLIDIDTLKALIKALDYSPTWHERLIGISYNVMTRVDVRRMFQLGIITADQVEAEYKHMGYSPENARWLRQWTEIEYNQDIKSYTKNAIIKSFLEGFLSEDQAKSYLMRIGFTPGRIEEILDMARYERGVAKRASRVAALRRLFVSGQYNADEVQADLRQFNIDDRVIAELLDTWKLEQKAGLKLPRVQDVLDWLARGVISDEDFKREMRRIGYSEYYVNLYYNAAKAKAVANA